MGLDSGCPLSSEDVVGTNQTIVKAWQLNVSAQFVDKTRFWGVQCLDVRLSLQQFAS